MNKQKIFKWTLLLFPIFFPFIYNFTIEGLFEDALAKSAAVWITSWIIFALFFKRSYCGFFCMFGAGQRLMNYIGLFLFRKRFVIPAYFDKYLRLIKYVVLLVVILMSVFSASLILDTSVPFKQYSVLFSAFAWVSISAIALALLGSLFVNNFFCKYFCTRGAMLALSGRFSPAGIVRNEENCLKCGVCSKNCPQNIQVHAVKKVTSMECVNCQRCLAVCPKGDVLSNSFASKKIPFWMFVIIMLISYIAILFVVSYTFNFFYEF